LASVGLSEVSEEERLQSLFKAESTGARQRAARFLERLSVALLDFSGLEAGGKTLSSLELTVNVGDEPIGSVGVDGDGDGEGSPWPAELF
jgi:hypothetical protein